jgi:porphobilinogen deaminase
VFSISNLSKHVQMQREWQAVMHHKNFLPAFGGGCDFYIYTNSNNNLDSYSNLGVTFESPNGAEYDTTVTQTYLAGRQRFSV